MQNHIRVGWRGRLRNPALAAMALVTLVGPALIAAPAQAATAHPAVTALVVRVVPFATNPRCGTGTSDGNVNTCITAFGSGLHVDEIVNTAQTIHDTRNLQICLRGPKRVIGCAPATGFKTVVPPNGVVEFDWSPDANEPPGDYCANTWRSNNDGTKTQVGHECINVHS